MLSAFEAAADIFDPQGPNYKQQPRQWAIDRIGVDLWSAQNDIIEMVRDNPRTAVASCHSAGKSFTAATVACWWIDSHPAGEAFVVTSAPTGDQVKAILWREIGRLHGKGSLPGRTNLTEWYIGGELVGIGRKPNEYEPTAFQGIHARFILVIWDEACGIPLPLWEAGSTLTSNRYARTLAIGNPDDPNGEFARVCKDGSGWAVKHISAFDTPNFTGEPVPEAVRDMLVSAEWVEEKKRTWGETSALYTSKVLGKFPLDTEFGVIPLSFIQRCRELELSPGLPVELGVDVGGGGDETVVTPRQGPKAYAPFRSRHDDPMRCVGEVLDQIRIWGATRCKVDSIGIGWGVAGRLDEVCREEGIDCEVIPVNVSVAADEPERFFNLRSELYWAARERSRLCEWDLSEIEEDTVAELTAHEYKILDSKGKVQVLSKDGVKDKLGRSPDGADSLILAFAEPYGEGEAGYGSVAAQTRIPGVDRSRRYQ